MDREPQLYDTLSKKGVFYRIIKIEDGIITAKRLKGDTNGKQGRPVTGGWEEIQARGYRLCDIPPVTVYKVEPECQEESAEREEETVEETQEREPDPAPEEVVEVCKAPEESEERCEEVRHVSNAVLITGMICLTMIVLALIDKE